MSHIDQIANELAGLNSSLVVNPVNPYVVPVGYFEDLAGLVISRIREEEGRPISQLETVSRQMPYSIPGGYFEQLGERVLSLVTHQEQTAAEELEAISPFLSKLDKQTPYTVPAGYFDITPGKQHAENNKVKVVAMTHRKWFRYAAAAIVIGLVTIAGFLVTKNHANGLQAGNKVMARFTKDVKKLDETQKDELIRFMDGGMTGEEIVQLNVKPATEEVKQLLKDVPDQELIDFQQQSEDIGDVLMTN